MHGGISTEDFAGAKARPGAGALRTHGESALQRTVL